MFLEKSFWVFLASTRPFSGRHARWGWVTDWLGLASSQLCSVPCVRLESGHLCD